MTAEVDVPTVDFLILADHAEAINGKMYLMGGGWDSRQVQDFAQPVPITIAAAVMVPWNATNQRHQLRLRVEDADGHQLAEVKVEFTTGRPPQLSVGMLQRVPLAFQQIPIRLPGPGVYVIVAEINGRDDKRIVFTAALAAGKSSNPQAA